MGLADFGDGEKGAGAGTLVPSLGRPGGRGAIVATAQDTSEQDFGRKTECVVGHRPVIVGHRQRPRMTEQNMLVHVDAVTL